LVQAVDQDEKKALVAIEHSILTAVWHMLTQGDFKVGLIL
jgi:hypothetical protein